MSIDDRSVAEEFNRRASLHRGIDAVLDAGGTPRINRGNLLRDAISKSVVRRYLRPHASDVILDVGCGVGRLTLYLSPMVRMIVGVDASVEMIKVAKERRDALGLGNADFVHVTGAGYPVVDGSVDKAFSFWVMGHMNDETVLGIARTVRGTITDAGRLYCFEQVHHEHGEIGAIQVCRTAEEYCRLFTAAGYRVLKTRHVIRSPSYALSLWNRSSGLGPWALPLLTLVERLTVHKRPELADYFTTAFVMEKRP